MIDLKPIAGLDINKGINQHSNNKENYLKVLRSFMVSTKSKLDIIENPLSGNSLKQYEITVHGIKGASRGIYAEEISNKASELEKAAEKGNIDFINDNNPAFLAELKTLLNELEEMFAAIESSIEKETRDKPDNDVLIKLLEACEIYDMMEVEAAMKKISKYRYSNDDGLAEWLRLRTEEMQYDQVTERLLAFFEESRQD